MISVVGNIGTENQWASRRHYVLNEVYESLEELIRLSKGAQSISLGTLKPLEIVDFVIEEKDREWKDKWLVQNQQGSFYELGANGEARKRRLVKALPYRYSYRFLTKGDAKPRELMIEDWEIGTLFWKSLRRSDGDEAKANQMVRRKYFDEFSSKKDIHLFVGTTKANHKRAPNPFIIIGVFYPPKTKQLPLL